MDFEGSDEHIRALEAIATDDAEALAVLLKSGGSSWDDSILDYMLRECLLKAQNCFPVILAQVVNINFADSDGDTILHWAVSENVGASADHVALLLRAGAAPNAKNKNGFTPLHILAIHGRYGDLIGTLLDHGANVNAENNDGWTPLHEMVYQGDSGIDLLCEHGANPNARNHEGQTPLHTIVRYGAGYKPLIRYGADVNALDNNRNTPLHLAVIADLATDGCGLVNEVVEWLLSEGADPYIKNVAGETALDLAAERDNKIVCGLIMSRITGAHKLD